jgi:mannose-6-phosphate isomerase-like protein (cupin superfamily)
VNGATISFRNALSQLPQPDGRRFVECFAHGTLAVELYAPRGVDAQTPHARDELYVVVSGGGGFVCDGERTRFVAGDALFVPARAVHRFEDFSEDFAAWVVFYGPDGGEAASIAGVAARAPALRSSTPT